MKKNLLHIDEIRFLIIHLILVNHWLTNIFITKKGLDTSLIDFTFEITSPVLSMISGYLFFYKTKEHFHYLKKLRARLHSLVIPYIVWTVAFFLIFFAMKEIFLIVFHTTYWFGPILSFNFTNLLSTFVNPPLINFWYLQNLILIIPFNFLFYYMLKNNYVW
ncbi:MAG TPA: acyltransferase family protein, partial [Puia sp.]|nr:acyltransferase family protein [Puia sp.]